MTTFSTQEIDIASEPITLLIKNRVMEKVVDLMGDIEKQIAELIIGLNLPAEVNLKNGKISKGEKYKFLPFVILDYPAFYSKEDVFAIRTMFHWGNFISISLHLKGSFLNSYGSKILSVYNTKPGIYFCTNHTEWEYDYSERNYQLLSLTSNELIKAQQLDHGFMKFSTKISIHEIHQTKEMVSQFISPILKLF